MTTSCDSRLVYRSEDSDSKGWTEICSKDLGHEGPHSNGIVSWTHIETGTAR